MFILIVIALLCIFLAHVYIRENKKANYWKKNGVQQVKHNTIFGILWNFVVQNGTLSHVYKDIYDMFPKEPYVGCYSGSNKTLILRDPKLFQYVLRTEFKVFQNRGPNVILEVNNWAEVVLLMEETRWRRIRNLLTPIFTTEKLRNMFPNLKDCAKKTENLMEKVCNEGQKHSLINIISIFTASSTGTSIFGLNFNLGNDLDSLLDKMARENNDITFVTNIKFLFAGILPNLYRSLKYIIFGYHENFFISFAKRLLKNKKERDEFFDNYFDIEKKEKLCDPASGYAIETSHKLMVGQESISVIAGVDPATTTINFTLYELAKNADILETLHREVDNLPVEHEELTYEVVNKMKYIEKVINESLRMYPPIGFIQRQCTIDHVMPDGLKIEKDVNVTIPILAVHTDPNIYPKPEAFDPERFCPEIEKERPNYTFLPFGEGDRLCVGMRYAKLQMKTGLIHFLRKFTVQLVDGSDGGSRELIYNKRTLTLRAENLGYKIVPR